MQGQSPTLEVGAPIRAPPALFRRGREHHCLPRQLLLPPLALGHGHGSAGPAATMGDKALHHPAVAVLAKVLAWPAAAVVAAPEKMRGQEAVVEDRPLGCPATPAIPALAQVATAEDAQARVPGAAEEVLGHPVLAVALTAALAEEEVLGHPAPAVA
ncbi:UNVERIFIED_CONTAM: hypothetical protein K2H54_043503 [Gekko kuhli]